MIKKLLSEKCLVVSCNTEFHRSLDNIPPYVTIECKLVSKNGLSEMVVKESFQTKGAFDETYKLLVAHWKGETL